MQANKITNFSCFGQDSFVIMQASDSYFILTTFRINNTNAIEQVKSISVVVQTSFQLAAVMQNVFIVNSIS